MDPQLTLLWCTVSQPLCRKKHICIKTNLYKMRIAFHMDNVEMLLLSYQWLLHNCTEIRSGYHSRNVTPCVSNALSPTEIDCTVLLWWLDYHICNKTVVFRNTVCICQGDRAYNKSLASYKKLPIKKFWTIFMFN